MPINVSKSTYSRVSKKLTKGQVKQVSKIVNKSKKYKMSYGGFTGGGQSLSLNTWTDLISSSGSQGLDNIIQGQESYERQGDTIMLKHYKMTVNISNRHPTFQATATDAVAQPQTYRIVVARLFGLYTGTVANYFTNSTINANFIVEKGTVLSDKRFFLMNSLDCKTMSINVPCKTKKVPYTLIQYNDSDPAGVEKNDIRVFFIALNGGPEVPIVDYSEHIGYYDKY